MLARGQLHCIGATTLAEYRQHIEKDAAFERRFQQGVYVISIHVRCIVMHMDAARGGYVYVRSEHDR